MPPAHILLTGASGLIGFRVLTLALASPEHHKVRCTARSESKAQTIASNPAVRALNPEDGDRLSFAIAADHHAFDEDNDNDMMQGITHIIHCGAPVPRPEFDPLTQVFLPTVSLASSILSAAARSPSVVRVVITSSIVGNTGVIPPSPSSSSPITASTRHLVPVPPDGSSPTTFASGFEAYVLSKAVSRRDAQAFFMDDDKEGEGKGKGELGFDVVFVVPGYVFGRNELVRDAWTARDGNSSSNKYLLRAMIGVDAALPLHDVYVHVDDCAELHLAVAFEERGGGKEEEEEEEKVRDVGVATRVDYGAVFGIVEGAFPLAVRDGVFTPGGMKGWPTDFVGSPEVRGLLGGRELRGFEEAVVDVAGQYLELLGRERA